MLEKSQFTKLSCYTVYHQRRLQMINVTEVNWACIEQDVRLEERMSTN